MNRARRELAPPVFVVRLVALAVDGQASAGASLQVECAQETGLLVLTFGGRSVTVDAAQLARVVLTVTQPIGPPRFPGVLMRQESLEPIE